jgi:uncharacterized iron-regulated protein
LNFPSTTALVAAAWLLAGFLPAAAAGGPDSCSAHVAQWLDPASGDVIASRSLFERIADSKIVLLGEEHTNAAHHRWQYYLLAALHSRNVETVLGLEMLPRRVQPVLDQWSAGKIDAAALLQRTGWDEVWGYDANLYLPLLEFARLNRLPTVALNVDRQLVSRVGELGWQGVPRKEREGLSDPAPASAEYRRSLAELYAYKQRMFGHGDAAADDEPNLDEVLQSDAFGRFVDAQLTWDRAMAEALAEAHRLEPEAQVIGIVGRGHLEHGYGIPHQLADLGIDGVTVLLPIDAGDDCAGLEAGLADSVFVIDAQAQDAPAPRPRLGILIENADGGVRVTDVVADSVAAHSGLRKGDIIRRAAGFETATASALIEVIQRQAPGTWLPLQVLRDRRELELVARFPQTFD